MTTPTVEEIVEEYAERLESTDFGGNIGCYVLAVKDSNDANSGVPMEIEKQWLRTTLTAYGNARYEEGVKAERERVREYVLLKHRQTLDEECMMNAELFIRFLDNK